MQFSVRERAQKSNTTLTGGNFLLFSKKNLFHWQTLRNKNRIKFSVCVATMAVQGTLSLQDPQVRFVSNITNHGDQLHRSLKSSQQSTVQYSKHHDLPETWREAMQRLAKSS